MGYAKIVRSKGSSGLIVSFLPVLHYDFAKLTFCALPLLGSTGAAPAANVRSVPHSDS
jgi:hypothetical protein